MQINQRRFKSLGTALMTLLLIEGITRIFVPSNSVWLEYARHAPNGLVRSGWTPSWRGKINIDGIGKQKGSYELRINSFGFRGQSMRTAVKPENTSRIFFMGGSFVEEMALPEEKTFPALVEKRLSAAYPARRFECVNAGISGFMSPDLFVQLKHQILNYEPDILIVTVPAINDIRYGTLPEYDTMHPLPQTNGKQPQTLLSHSRLLSILYRFAGRYQQAHTPYHQTLEKFKSAASKTPYILSQQSKAYEVFTQQLQAVIDLAKKEHVQVILMSEPSVYQTPLPQEIKNLLWMGFMRKDLNLDPFFLEKEMVRFNYGARLIAEKDTVRFLDLASAIQKNTTHFYDDVHLTPAGSLTAAKVISQWLIDQKIFSTGSA